jgi:hypothetical protein
MLTTPCGDRAAAVFHQTVTPHDEAPESSGESVDERDRSDAAGEGHGSGVDAAWHAGATSVETLLDEVRTACRNVRDAMRDLWR